jgi:RNA polymerase sigma-70 factor (ECF subfamily)
MSNPKDDEARWVELARQGDSEAFWALVERHGPMVHRLLRRLVKDRERAEDLFSETFLKAADHIEKFRGEARFSTWLVSIAVNLSRNEMKRDRRRQHISWDDVIPTESHSHGSGAPSLAEWANPHDILEQKELRELLDDGIESLPPSYRVVFTLRDIEGLSTAETAAALGLTETAVKSRAARARLALRKFLTPHFGTPASEASRA